MIRELLEWKFRRQRVGFVPTMGALHAGHLSLIEEARKHCDHVIVSIFVNPTQFNKSADLENYPKTEYEDIALLVESGAHLAYLPGLKEVYPEGYSQPHYELGALESVMEGSHRPGHFQGVAAVLDRFFQDVAPDMAFFGEKDYQQLAVVRQLVRLCQFPIEIIGCPTLREDHGLAMSSRNMRLSTDAFKRAGIIHEGLTNLQKAFGKTADAKLLEETIAQWNEQADFETEYLTLARADNFQSPQNGEDLSRHDWRLFTAVNVEGVRLIDNLPLRPE